MPARSEASPVNGTTPLDVVLAPDPAPVAAVVIPSLPALVLAVNLPGTLDAPASFAGTDDAPPAEATATTVAETATVLDDGG